MSLVNIRTNKKRSTELFRCLFPYEKSLYWLLVDWNKPSPNKLKAV